jgi:hypothetical protein
LLFFVSLLHCAMPHPNVYTRVILQEGIQVKIDETTLQKGVFATRNLPPRHLILLEQTLVQTRPAIIDIVAYRPEMFDELYPRHVTWAACSDHEERKRLVDIKLTHNTFAYANNSRGEVQSHLGILASSFNHACDPNAVFLGTGDGGTSLVTLMAGCTTRAIQAGEQVCINYGNATVHAPLSLHPYKCSCTHSQAQLVQWEAAAIHISEEALSTPAITRIIDQARIDPNSLDVGTLQASASVGYFLDTSGACIVKDSFRMDAALQYPDDTSQIAIDKLYMAGACAEKAAYLNTP